MSDESPAIAARGLVRLYGEHRALDGLDLTIRRGQVFGFLGPNGAGKTAMPAVHRADDRAVGLAQAPLPLPAVPETGVHRAVRAGLRELSWSAVSRATGENRRVLHRGAIGRSAP